MPRGRTHHRRVAHKHSTASRLPGRGWRCAAWWGRMTSSKEPTFPDRESCGKITRCRAAERAAAWAGRGRRRAAWWGGTTSSGSQLPRPCGMRRTRDATWQGGMALSGLVGRNDQLRELDLSWNSMRASASEAICTVRNRPCVLPLRHDVLCQMMACCACYRAYSLPSCPVFI